MHESRFFGAGGAGRYSVVYDDFSYQVPLIDNVQWPLDVGSG